MDTATQHQAQVGTPRRRRRRFGRILLAVVVGLAVALVAVFVGLRIARAGALPGVTVADVDVGGMSNAQLHAALTDYGERRAAEEITVTLEDQSASATARELGYRFDAEATADAVLRRGRQANVVVAARDQVRAFREVPVAVEPVEHVDQAQVDAWADEVAADLSYEPVEGDAAIDGTSVARVDPEPGVEVDADDLRALLRRAVAEPGDETLEAPSRPVEPQTTVADVDAIVAEAETVVSGPVTLARDGTEVTFSAEDLAGLFEIERTADADDAFALRFDASGVGDLIPQDAIDAVETSPQNARITVNQSAGEVSISESSNGFAFDEERAAEQVHALATSDDEREATWSGEILEPELSTEEAEELQVVERVSSFTTEHACCEGRVQNIQRMADLVDGALILPGETFSLNGHVGPRTREKGFTDGGAIIDGEFEDRVGGGVSQFATTMFNAAYFGGYDIVEHQPHSYYISRYPEGREATISYNSIDLKVHNNSPYGAVVKTSYTGTSITVSFWGREWVEVDSVTGPRQNIRRGAVRDGFDIQVTRILRYPDGEEEREQYYTSYRPEN